ncbi:MAG: protein-export chaperone SecB [Alphaproteobacteria bacterium]|nr:protein-export chaperone SecB [Alphaproteobacteria bacterium]
MNTAPETAPEQPAAIALRAQYVKDLSFENPKAPQSLFTLKEPPTMEVAVNLGAQRLDQDVFELSIHINARAIAENTTVFMADLTYAGVLEIKGIPEDAIEQIVFIQGAFLIYPFARRVISDVTRDGGFPPLQMEPIDFFALYQQNRAKPAA